MLHFKITAPAGMKYCMYNRNILTLSVRKFLQERYKYRFRNFCEYAIKIWTAHLVRECRISFFYSLRSKSKRIWILFASYSHVFGYLQTPFICIIRFIFTSKCLHIFKYSIWCKNTCCSEYSLQSEYSLRMFSNWQIFVSKYSFRSEYSRNLKRITIRFIFAFICIESNFAALLHSLTYIFWQERFESNCA
jgi:hypothetical protein